MFTSLFAGTSHVGLLHGCLLDRNTSLGFVALEGVQRTSLNLFKPQLKIEHHQKKTPARVVLIFSSILFRKVKNCLATNIRINNNNDDMM